MRARTNEFMEVFSPKKENLDGINMLLSMLAVPVAAGGAMFYKRSKFSCIPYHEFQVGSAIPWSE